MGTDCGALLKRVFYIRVPNELFHKFTFLNEFHYLCRRSTLGMEILVGTNNINSGGTYYRAEVFKMHNDYGKGGMKRLGDIAVLRIAEKFSFDEKVQPIELYPNTAPEVPGGVEASKYTE